jgi:hypothetical protein
MPLQLLDAEALASAYRAARYVAATPAGALAVAVGAPAPALEAAIEADSFAFITAWNPASRPRDEDANRNADLALVAQLGMLESRRWPMRASAPDGDWGEPGWLLAGIDPESLDRLARAFGQAGTLFWRRGEPVRLRMALPKPPGARCDATDWLE